MLSLVEISAVEIAINLCNSREIKREILCATTPRHARIEIHRHKEFWHEMTGRRAKEILNNLGLPKQLHGDISGAIFSLGMKMLNWALYHERILGFSRDYSVNFLNSSFLKQPGIFDSKKAAEELMKDNSLSAKQKYTLACIYCFKDDIPDLYKQMRRRNEGTSRRFSDPQEEDNERAMLRFWTVNRKGQLGHLEEESLNELMFVRAVESGNKTAVQYCLERAYLGREIVALEAAVNVLERSWEQDDYFDDENYVDREELSVRKNYYADVLYLLLSKLTDDEKKEFFSNDPERCRLLHDLLNWPYHNYFMSLVKLISECFTEEIYDFFLRRICDKIQSRDGTLMCGGQRSCYYKKILKEFWLQIPERCQRYVLYSEEIKDLYESVFNVHAGGALLAKLIKLKNFDCDDKENIQLILSSATIEEKRSILFCDGWRKICVRLIAKKRWEILDLFVSNCFSSKQQAAEFLKGLIYTQNGQGELISFAQKGEWNTAESFIRWVASTEEEMKILKKELISSSYGISACFSLIHSGVEALDRFIRWYFLSEEALTAFKKEFIFSEVVLYMCKDLLILENELELFDEFTNFCLSSKNDIRQLKRYVAYSRGGSICEEFLLGYRDDYSRVCNRASGCLCYKCNGCRWEEVEKFLTWCFSSEEEIREFKRDILNDRAMLIHFRLLASNNWEDADIFLAWLGLSSEEIKELKKKTLFSHREARGKFIYLMHMKESDETKREAIGFLLRWYLTDKETLLEFSGDFRRWYIENEKVNEQKGEVLKNFDLAVTLYLDDLDEEQKESR